MIRAGLPLLAAALTCATPAAARDAGEDALTDAGSARDHEDAPAPVDLTAMVDDAIRRLARSRNEDALAAFERKDLPAALAAFRQAHDLDPADAEITNNLAYLYQLLGNRAESERLYRETLRLDPRRTVVRFNLADLLSGPGATPEQLTEAATLLARTRELKGNQPRILERQALVAARRERFEEAERFYRERANVAPVGDALCVEIGDFYRDLDRPDDALRWYQRVNDPDGLLEVAVRRIREVEIEREARRYGWTRATDAVPDRATRLAERGRAHLRQHQHAEAARLLREAVRIAPRFAQAHADLGDALDALSDPAGAELTYLRAVAMEGGDPEILTRVGEFYLRQARGAESAVFLSRALQLRPDFTELHLRLAHAWQAAGELPRALEQAKRFLALAPDDPAVETARALEQSLELSLGVEPEPPPGAPSGDTDTPPPAQQKLYEALGRARALAARGQPDAAMAELGGVTDEPAPPEVLTLRGQILRAAGRLDEAAAAFEASLRARPGQGEVLEQLGALHLQRGEVEAGRARLEQAESAGARLASLTLARLDSRLGATPIPRWLADAARWRQHTRSRARLERFLANDPPVRHAEEARELLAELEVRHRASMVGLSLSGLVVLAALGLLAWRRWGGDDLRALISAHPETGPEVQQILAAVRHEVLKHNTMVLTGLVSALEDGDPEAPALASWCRRSLLGAPAETEEDDSAEARLRGYADQLARLGRSRGRRLNLERRDPALSALLRGFATLRRLAGTLDRVARLPTSARRNLASRLRHAARLLNVEGYEAVRALLDQLRVLSVDAALLRLIFERTAREPAFSAATVAPLTFDDDGALPAPIGMPRHALEDVLANLIRNALQSMLRHGGSPTLALRLATRTEVDPITGIERLVIRIEDRSPQRLTPEMLRGRYIEDGLGLTADLVSRYEGTLDVAEAEPPWTKAVVVKLPRVEDGGDALPGDASSPPLPFAAG